MKVLKTLKCEAKEPIQTTGIGFSLKEAAYEEGGGDRKLGRYFDPTQVVSERF